MDALMPHTWLLIIAGGFTVGFLIGLTGVGAGSLMTPFLISVIGVPPVLAVGTDLPFASLSARRLIGTDIVHAIPLTFLAGASHFWMGNVDLQILGMLLIGSVPGIALGSRITGLVPDWFLRITLALVLFWAAYSLVNAARH